MVEGYKECMAIAKKWEETPPISLKKANTAAEDMKTVAVETMAITTVVTLVWLMVTVALYF